MDNTPPVTTRSDRRRSRPEAVAEELKSLMVRQGLRPGDRLPGEAELIEHFAMAKGTIREAMRISETQGLIRTRTGPGGGSFVAEVGRDRAKRLLGNYFYFHDLRVDDIYQLRCLLEPELAADLAGRLSPEVLDELRAITRRYDAPSTSPEEERDQHIASLEFHKVLAREAANPVLGFMLDFLATMLSDLTVWRALYAPANRDLWQSGRDSQLRLLAAMERGDSAEARRIMAEHMTRARHLMAAQEAALASDFLG